METSNGSSTATDQINLIEEIDVQKYLVLDGSDVKGGEINALIVHASKVQKFSENGEFPIPFGSEDFSPVSTHN